MSLLRAQQREIAELRQNQMELMQRLTDHLDAVQSSLMGHIERVLDSQQEQERILSTELPEGPRRSLFFPDIFPPSEFRLLGIVASQPDLHPCQSHHDYFLLAVLYKK